MNDLLLKGSRHSLTLCGYQESWDGWTGSEYSERQCTRSRWCGTGVLIHTASKEIIQFGWDSWTSMDCRVSFEDSVFYPGFYARTYYSQLQIIDREAFLDYFIEIVIRKLAEQEPSGSGLPRITLPELDMDYMRENGIIPGYNGQICFNLNLEGKSEK